MMLRWLHPLLMTTIFGLCLYFYCIPKHGITISAMQYHYILMAYFVLLSLLNRTYHALEVGLVRIGELVYSQTLGLLITNCLIYITVTSYCRTFISPLPLLIVLATQFGLCTLWSIVANRIYFASYPAPKTAIVYMHDSDLARVESIRYFTEHFDVRRLIKEPKGDPSELLNQLNGMQAVFVAGIDSSMRGPIAKYCVENNVLGYFMPRLSEIIMAGAEHMQMFSEPVMRIQRAKTKSDYLLFKRIIDIFASAIGLIIASPVMLVTAMAIKLNDGGPVFYRQKRLTKNGRVFSILKFRSMNVNAEKDGVARLASEHDSRITPIGRFIRATRIDELPQLINILFGDMSLLGPRPERPEIAAEYEKELPEFALRLQVKAGLSGMAQVYGRYNTDPYSKLQMDLMYINKLSFRTDLRLLFATVKILFMKESTEGIQEGMRTAASASTADTAADRDNKKLSA